MKIILGLRRQHYMARVSIFLIVVALIAGMVGCAQPAYNLAIVSTAGGNVTTPGEGMFTYDEGTVVNLTVEVEEGYRFVNWTGDVGSIANVNATITTITMNGSYFITANFVAAYDLTISSTAGGNVTIPGEGTFTYDVGTVVSLNAAPDAGYQFVNWTGDVSTIGNVNAAATIITTNGDYEITANFEEVHFMVAAGSMHTVGLKSDGTVVAVGYNTWGQCNFAGWTNIWWVGAGYDHTVGLMADGTVVAVGHNDHGQLDVGNWTGIVQVAVGAWHTVGVKSDGTVVAVGVNFDGQCNVGNWTDIIRVSGRGDHTTVGLKSDGTVVAVGQNGEGQCNVGNWTGITQVAAGSFHTVGVKSDGTVVAVGNNGYGQCNVGDWTNVTQVAAGSFHTVGLKSDGTVVAVGQWQEGQCNVGGWDLD
jgi:uncharacterized repeat protein (TIGR02543 family)